MEGELVSPLLMAPVHIDPSCLHPDLLTEVQHVVIAREQLLLHLNQVIGRGQFQFHNHQNSSNARVHVVFAMSVLGKQTSLAAILLTWSNYGFGLFFSGGKKESRSQEGLTAVNVSNQETDFCGAEKVFTALEQRSIENTLPIFGLVRIIVHF